MLLHMFVTRRRYHYEKMDVYSGIKLLSNLYNMFSRILKNRLESIGL